MTSPNSEIELSLSYKQTEAFDLLEENDVVTELLYGGAAGGGKTFFGCVWQLYRRQEFPGTRGLIGRSKLKNLRKTTLKTFFEVAKKYFPDFKYNYNQNDSTIKFDNGSEIVLQDLFLYPSDPDFTSLGSAEYTDAFIDEGTEITQKAFDIVNSRMRYMLDVVGGVPKVLITANPAHNWVKFRFVMSDKNLPITLKDYQDYISARVDDNPDKVFVKTYKMQLNKMHVFDRKRLLFGDWAVIENDEPFFHSFNIDTMVTKEPFHLDPQWEVLESFDFNINPTTCIVGQKIAGKGLFFYAVHQKKGGTEELCKELVQYNDYLVSITGDHSGNSGNSAAGVLAGGQYNTDFSIIAEALGVAQRNFLDTRTPNKMHTYSRRLCNTVMTRIPIFINPFGCEALISDLQTAQPTSQGKLMKDRDMHKQDVGDAFRYIINAWFLGGMRDVNQFANTLI